MIELPNVEQLALIAQDISNDSLKAGGAYPGAGSAPGSAQLIANNALLLEAARRRGIAVFHTGHYLRPDYKDVAPGGNSARYGALQDGSWGAEPIEELKPLANEWRIRKGGGYSAFTGTPLDKQCGVWVFPTPIIGGAGTHAGIEAMVRDMREHDYHAVIASDACSGAGTANHAASMLTLTFAQIGTTQDVIKALNRADN